MVSRQSLIDNWNRVLSQVSNCVLVAVSKSKPISDIEVLYEAGQRHFGENRVKELYEKSKHFESKQITWHFIGHLQSNKINQLLTCSQLGYIHSVDSLDLLKNLFKRQDQVQSDEVKVFLQFNTSGESQKGGFTNYDELVEAIDLFHHNLDSKFKLYGLMTMATYRSDDYREDAKICFRKLKNISVQIQEQFDLSLKLSMGMSRDYHLAMQEGSDYLRVGSTIFGQRN